LHSGIVATPGAGLSIYVTSIRAQNNNTTPALLSIFDATGPLHTEVFVMAGVQGAGVEAKFDPPWEIGDNDAVSAQQTAAADSYGTINGYVAAST
jgi:hypothetical protein